MPKGGAAPTQQARQVVQVKELEDSQMAKNVVENFHSYCAKIEDQSEEG